MTESDELTRASRCKGKQAVEEERRRLAQLTPNAGLHFPGGQVVSSVVPLAYKVNSGFRRRHPSRVEASAILADSMPT